MPLLDSVLRGMGRDVKIGLSIITYGEGFGALKQDPQDTKGLERRRAGQIEKIIEVPV